MRTPSCDLAPKALEVEARGSHKHVGWVSLVSAAVRQLFPLALWEPVSSLRAWDQGCGPDSARRRSNSSCLARACILSRLDAAMAQPK